MTERPVAERSRVKVPGTAFRYVLLGPVLQLGCWKDASRYCEQPGVNLDAELAQCNVEAVHHGVDLRNLKTIPGDGLRVLMGSAGSESDHLARLGTKQKTFCKLAW